VGRLSSRPDAPRARHGEELERAVTTLARAVGAHAGAILQFSREGGVRITGVWRAMRKGSKLSPVSIAISGSPGKLLRAQPVVAQRAGSLPEGARRVAEFLDLTPVDGAIEVPLRRGWIVVGALVLFTAPRVGRLADPLFLQLAGELIGHLLSEKLQEEPARTSVTLAHSSAAPSVSVQGVIDSLPEEIALLDRAGRAIAANQAWLAAKGLPRIGESYLQHWEGGRVAEAAEIARGIHKVMEGQREFRSRFRTTRPDRFTELLVRRIELKRSFDLLVVHRDVSQQERGTRALRQLSRRLIRAQEEERRRIARELHGQTAQNLTAISLALARAEQSLATRDSTGLSLLRETRELAERSVAEIRTLSYLLHPPLLDEEGLASAAHWYVSGFVKRSGIRTDLHFSENFGRLPRDIELALFNVIQECLTNVYRHSGSGTAHIDLRRERRRAVVEVSNEGGRLTTEQRAALRKSVGLGIRGIRERLNAVGGTFELRPRAKGLTAVATVPLSPRRTYAHPDR
jgi:signal transduction histidine kinase